MTKLHVKKISKMKLQ